MRKLEGLVKEIVDELGYLKKREERFQNTNSACLPSPPPPLARISHRPPAHAHARTQCRPTRASRTSRGSRSLRSSASARGRSSTCARSSSGSTSSTDQLTDRSGRGFAGTQGGGYYYTAGRRGRCVLLLLHVECKTVLLSACVRVCELCTRTAQGHRRYPSPCSPRSPSASKSSTTP